jgi:nitrile hydratase
MDTVHDLGGRQGFGPIRWQTDNDSQLFHEEWQARTWAICMMMFGQFRREQTGWTLDWHRHIIERTGPAEYLCMNYFDKWAQHMMATLIDEDIANLEEFLAGHAHRPSPPFVKRPATASREPDPPRFQVGDTVVTRRDITSMHTRLPGYARGRTGVIDREIGQEILADASAEGDIRKEQLYTVKFDSSELWPNQVGGQYAVRLDLWDSYLEPV